MTKLYDISRRITSSLAVWPGDASFSFEQVLAKTAGDSVNLTTLRMSAHTGTHIDASWHYDQAGEHPAEMALWKYIGRAHVATVRRKSGGITPADIPLSSMTDVERLLLHTWVSDLSDEQWPVDFPYPTPELIHWLAEGGVVLLGVDMPSVDRFDDEQLPVHHLIYHYGIVNIESLYLHDVPDGVYDLVALPLKLDSVCGSPVRAVLREL